MNDHSITKYFRVCLCALHFSYANLLEMNTFFQCKRKLFEMKCIYLLTLLLLSSAKVELVLRLLFVSNLS